MSVLARLRWRARGWLRSRRRAPSLAPATDAELAEIERRIVWIFGSPRSGTTWLLRLLAAAPGERAVGLDEPSFGRHLAAIEFRTPEGDSHPVAIRANERLARGESYLFSKRYESTWRPQLRSLILERVRAEAEDRGGEGLIAIKEPHGSEGADLIAELVPGSRLIHLLRDPRDVLDSMLDAELHPDWVRGDQPGLRALTDAERLSFIEHRAAALLQRHRAIERAAGILGPERATQVRYESLLADTEGELARLYGWLGVEADAQELATIAAREAFAAIPAEQRGPGKVFRSATPGLWRQNLRPEEVALTDQMLADLLRDYP